MSFTLFQKSSLKKFHIQAISLGMGEGGSELFNFSTCLRNQFLRSLYNFYYVHYILNYVILLNIYVSPPLLLFSALLYIFLFSPSLNYYFNSTLTISFDHNFNLFTLKASLNHFSFIYLFLTFHM